MDEVEKIVRETVAAEAGFLNSISQEIWKKPELKFEEAQAHDLLVRVLGEKGFTVVPHFVLVTAFRAEFSSGPGPTIAILCEYDALPDVGHACGHNLIAEAGLGAALAVKKVLESNIGIHGKVVVLGTPAEEGGGGKIRLIQAGAFKEFDAALMVHPSTYDHLYPPFIAAGHLTVTFSGKETHASGYPWEGLNALDAAVASYNNAAFLRQHIKPTCRIHGVITNGGTVPNVIPGLTEVKYMYRAATGKDFRDLQQRLVACCTSAAKATGCEVDIMHGPCEMYESLMSNRVLCEIYRKYAEKLGVKFQDGNHKVIPFMASSDMGNVTHVVPGIHPTYSIGTTAVNHSAEFATASGKPEAQQPTLIASQCMALVALEVMLNSSLLEDAKTQFQQDLAED